MNRSPVRVIELCVYALIILAAIIWLVAGGRLYKAPVTPDALQSASQAESAPPPDIVPNLLGI